MAWSLRSAKMVDDTAMMVFTDGTDVLEIKDERSINREGPMSDEAWNEHLSGKVVRILVGLNKTEGTEVNIITKVRPSR